MLTFGSSAASGRRFRAWSMVRYPVYGGKYYQIEIVMLRDINVRRVVKRGVMRSMIKLNEGVPAHWSPGSAADRGSAQAGHRIGA